MKKIQKIALKEATILTNEEMKFLFGGSAVPTDPDEESGQTKKRCNCNFSFFNGNSDSESFDGYNISAESCTSSCANKCAVKAGCISSCGWVSPVI